jgi:hypothetical protein
MSRLRRGNTRLVDPVTRRTCRSDHRRAVGTACARVAVSAHRPYAVGSSEPAVPAADQQLSIR